VSKIKPVPCPRCSGAVFVRQSGGGRGTGDLTSYCASCEDCDMLEDHFGDNGRLDNAVRHYNRWARDELLKLSGGASAPKKKQINSRCPLAAEKESDVLTACADLNKTMDPQFAFAKSGSGWLPMSSAPTDGTTILVCEMVPGNDEGQVMPAVYMRAHGNPALEGFWGCLPTSRLPPHLMHESANSEGFQVGWRNIALTALCWKPLPLPEDFNKLRRRQSQILRHKHKPASTSESQVKD